MNWFEKFIALLQFEWDKPSLYGWKHLMFLAFMVVGVIVVFVTCKNLSEKQFRILMLTLGIILLVLEVFKQLVFSYDSATNTWEYDWKQFPFQFCSTPMYVMFLVGLLKECKFRDYLCSFLGTFGIFAGAIVMFYPSTVLSEVAFRFCQSMIHHSLMVIGGMIVVVSNKIKFEHKTILKSMLVFAIFLVIAVIMNIVFHLSGNTSSFNMFYVGPFDSCDIPVLHDIGNSLNIDADYLHFGNFIFILLYFIAFSIAGYLILLLEIFINKKVNSRQGKQDIGV